MSATGAPGDAGAAADEPEDGSSEDVDLAHDALVELNELRVAMRMDPVEPGAVGHEHPVGGDDDGQA